LTRSTRTASTRTASTRPSHRPEQHPTFADLGVPPALVRRLDTLGLTSPFPIQAATLPDALAGRDVCGRAPTGSGKTLAFSLPLAANVGRGTPRRPRGLVLVPTRELAAQVRDTLLPLAEQRQRRVATLYGGTNIRRDQQRLRGGVDLVVATPGRLADLVRRGDVSLADVDLVVLDEADRMADMGFLPEVKRLLDATSPDRQTLLFSATLDGDVDVLVRRYQTDPVRHEVAVPEEEHGEVRHVFLAAERPERRRLTGDIVRGRGRAIVFTRTKHGADRLAKQLAQDGISTAAIHGNRSQNQRERALDRFHRGEVTALIATDVAARGIHVDDVAVVVHHDLPATDKDYVHRSGRTGRAGADGIVVCLVGDEQRADADAIQRSLGLPRGLHRKDVGLLDVAVLPAPAASPRTGAAVPTASAGHATDGRPRGGARPPSARRRTNGQQPRSGGGQRSRTRRHR
jgi:superfamily II DNA/RNA helicase